MSACDLPGGAQGRLVTASMQHDGRTRTYRLHLPAGLHDPAPLVILLHGAGGDGRSMESGTGFDSEADRLGMLAAYPDGVDHFWNAGFCCPRPVPVATDDVAFVAALIDRIAAGHRVDRARVYIAGFSNGGYMVFRLACALADRLAAVAAAGADSQECPAGRPSAPVSVLQVHGTADDRNRGHVQSLASGTWLETPVDAAEQWRLLDGCSASPATSSSGPDRRTDWKACRSGTEVDYHSVAGGGHTWPRSSPDASRLAADFFQAHHR